MMYACFDLFISWLRKGLPLLNLIARKYLTFVNLPVSYDDRHDLEEKRGGQRGSDIQPHYFYGMRKPDFLVQPREILAGS